MMYKLFTKVRRKIVAVTVALGVMVLPLYNGTILASTLEKKQPILSDVTAEVKSELLNKVLNGDNFKKIQGKYDVDTKNIIVRKLSDSYDLTVAGVPIADNTGYDYSKYIEFFDSKGKLQNWLLLKFTKKENNIYNLHAEMQNGSKADMDATESGEIVNGSVIGADGLSKDLNDFLQKTTVKPSVISSLMSIKKAYAWAGFSCLTSCLSSLGVPSWAIALIGAVCAMACAVTVGVGCYVCIAALGIGLGAELGYCLEDCGYGT